MDEQLGFLIRADAPEPIYRQLMEQVRRRVAAGDLKAGEEMPSVRETAQKLRISKATISHAYALLEAEGVLERRRGAAMRVASQHGDGDAKALRRSLLRPALQRVAEEAKQLRMSTDETLVLFKEVLDS